MGGKRRRLSGCRMELRVVSWTGSACPTGRVPSVLVSIFPQPVFRPVLRIGSGRSGRIASVPANALHDAGADAGGQGVSGALYGGTPRQGTRVRMGRRCDAQRSKVFRPCASQINGRRRLPIVSEAVLFRQSEHGRGHYSFRPRLPRHTPGIPEAGLDGRVKGDAVARSAIFSGILGSPAIGSGAHVRGWGCCRGILNGKRGKGG